MSGSFGTCAECFKCLPCSWNFKLRIQCPNLKRCSIDYVTWRINHFADGQAGMSNEVSIAPQHQMRRSRTFSPVSRNRVQGACCSSHSQSLFRPLSPHKPGCFQRKLGDPRSDFPSATCCADSTLEEPFLQRQKKGERPWQTQSMGREGSSREARKAQKNGGSYEPKQRGR